MPNQISGIIEWDPLLINGNISVTLADFDLIDYKFLDYKVFDRFSGKVGPLPIGGKNCE